MANDAFLLQGTIGLDTTPLKQGMADTKKMLDDLKTSADQTSAPVADVAKSVNVMSEAMKAFAAVGGIYAVKALGDYVFNLAKTGAENERTERSFRSLVKAPEDLLAVLDRAAGGTIRDNDLMASSSKAALLGLGDDVTKMGDLMEIARFKGRALGKDTTEAYDMIVEGVGRLSNRSLMGIGVTIDLAKTYEAYATSLGLTAKDLTEVQQRQALLNAVIAQNLPQARAGGGGLDDDLDKFERMNVQVDTLKDKWAEFILKTGTVQIGLDFMTKGMSGWITAFEAMDAIDKWIKEHGAEGGAGSTGLPFAPEAGPIVSKGAPPAVQWAQAMGWAQAPSTGIGGLPTGAKGGIDPFATIGQNLIPTLEGVTKIVDKQAETTAAVLEPLNADALRWQKLGDAYASQQTPLESIKIATEISAGSLSGLFTVPLPVSIQGGGEGGGGGGGKGTPGAIITGAGTANPTVTTGGMTYKVGGFQTGGVVPGSGPIPIIAHGGELVLTQGQQALLDALLNRVGITQHFEGNTFELKSDNARGFFAELSQIMPTG